MVTSSDLIPAVPDAATMERAGIELRDIEDFQRACMYLQWRMLGRTRADAAKEIGVHPNTLYTPRWKMLIAKAEIVIKQDTETIFKAASTVVAESFLKALTQLMKDAADPLQRLSDRVQALQFVHEAFGSEFATPSRDDSEAVSFLNKDKIANPMAPIIHVAAGGTVNVVSEPKPDTHFDIEIPEEDKPDEDGDLGF